MVKFTRSGSAKWQGGLKDGKATVSTQSGALSDQPYGFNTRFEDKPGTNPEELVGAAHASCFSMALSKMLEEAGIGGVSIETTSKITLICGLLLPIWDRLPADNMRIYRLQTEDGERAIGRLVSQEQLSNVYARLGLDCQIEMSPQEVLAAVMDARTTLNLLGGYQLRRSLVMGQPRCELIGASGAALPALKAMGCFTEVIQWKTRVFIPVDGTDVLARVLAEHPVGASVADAAA